jgi:hypothetical protein
MKRIGFYSLIRYVEDSERGETVNVGTLLQVDERVYKKFVDRERTNGGSDVVHRFESTLDELLQGGISADSEDPDARELPPLATLARRRFPHFEVSEPRQIVVDQDPDSVLERLSRRLVEEPAVSALR